MLRLPRLGPPERRSPVSSVLSEHYDFLRRIRSRLYFRFSAPTDPLLVRSRAAERSAGPGPVQARYRWLLSAGQSQDLPGSWGIRPVPLPRSRIPASSSDLALSARRCSPHFADNEDTSTTDILETQSRGFSTRCLRFKWCVTEPACKARFRPVANLCREGVKPSGFHRKVSVPYIGLLSQVYPGATAKLPYLASNLASAAKSLRG